MTRVSLSVLALAASLSVLGCEGREVTVFDLPAKLGSAGSGGAGSSGSAGSAGTMTAPSGASSGGTAADSGSFGGGGSDSNATTTGGVAGMNGTGGTPPTPCSGDPDCSPGWLCDKQGCDATTGLCVPWPAICPPNPSPVCGCDGVTYWNDCLRLQTVPSAGASHTALAGPDQCRATACTCEVGSDCKVPYASCSHLLAPGEMCGHAMGNCWMLPPQCEPNADPKMWRECKPPDAVPQPMCVTTCDAIASEHSYAELHRGDTCN